MKCLLPFLIILTLFFRAFANDSQTEINSMILKPLNFANEVAKSLSQVDANLKSPTGCVEFISDKLDKIDRLKSDSFFPQSPDDIAELEAKGNETLARLFHIQLVVRAKQRELSKSGNLNFECLQNIRRSSRYLRFMEDMLIEWLIERGKVNEFSSRILSGKFPQLMTNVDKVEFQLGDLFLIRGKSYVSGMIARIGDAELQFSHLAILGEDGKNQKVIIEALIPYGTKITPLDEWLNQKEARVVLFRFQDKDTAAKAGRAAYDLAHQFISKHGYNIPYDFHMSSLDTDYIFCAELIENAYLTASSSKVLLPEHKSMTTKFKSTPFLRNMGINASEIFAPGDIEFDSRFDLLAEYRYLEKNEETGSIPLLRKIRMQDAIIQSIYNWTIIDNYQFVDSWEINLKTVLAKLFRYTGFLKDRMPTHMPYSSLKTVIQFEDASHIIESHLFPIEAKFYSQKKHSLHFQEMLKILKDFRNAECERSNSDLNNLLTARTCLKKPGREI